MPVAAENQDPAIVLEDISKSFGGARALDRASLVIEHGEVHGLLGENGSGKSTLIKVLSGFHAPDGGQIQMNGEAVPLPMPPGLSRDLGIGFVHQDLGLVPSLTVLDNLRIGSFAAKTSWRLSWSAERRAAQQLLDEYGLHVELSAKVANLRPVERAMLAIIRAVQDIREVTRGSTGTGTGLLVLDETTVFLPADEKDHLFRVVREIANRSASVLFVSHDLDEVLTITDRVTVLRDGRVQGTVRTAATTVPQLVEMIVGRAVEMERIDRTAPITGREVIVIDGLEMDGVRYPVIEARGGEVVGLTGLPGTGFDRLPYAVFGAAEAEGTLSMGGQRYELRTLNPERAVRLGIGLLPSDRLRQGGVGSLPVEDNVMSHVLPRYRRPYGLRRRAITRAAQDLMERFDVRPRDPSRPLQTLSGGNQQKALVGKWLQLGMHLWLLHEPTQGVDIGARQQIFRDVRAAAKTGMIVLCASNDHEQLEVLCDRVLVFGSNGGIRELTGDDITKNRISAACFEMFGNPTAADEDGDGGE